jgi:hypothetical protein
MAQIPTPDLAVPYAAPKQVKTMADVHPMAPKNGYENNQYDDFDDMEVGARHGAEPRNASKGRRASGD